MSHEDEQLSRLYKKLNRHEPSEMIDARIRKEARLHHKKLHSSSSFSWISPQWLSVAAVLVLSVALVLRVVDEVPLQKNMDQMLQPAEEFIESRSLPDDEKQRESLADRVESDMEKQLKPVEPVEPVESGGATAPIIQAEVQTAIEEHRKRTPISSPVSSPVHSPAKLKFYSSDQADGVPNAKTVPKAELKSVKLCGLKDFSRESDRQQWLERIKQLRAANRIEEADCLQKAFLQEFSSQ